MDSLHVRESLATIIGEKLQDYLFQLSRQWILVRRKSTFHALSKSCNFFARETLSKNALFFSVAIS
jgi:hypothetical protein